MGQHTTTQGRAFYPVLNSAFHYPENMKMAFSTANMNELRLWHSLCFLSKQHLFHNRVLLPHDLPELLAQSCLKISVPVSQMNTTALLGPRFMHVVLPHDPPELLRHPRRVLLAPEDLVEILK